MSKISQATGAKIVPLQGKALPQVKVDMASSLRAEAAIGAGALGRDRLEKIRSVVPAVPPAFGVRQRQEIDKILDAAEGKLGHLGHCDRNEAVSLIGWTQTELLTRIADKKVEYDAAPAAIKPRVRAEVKRLEIRLATTNRMEAMVDRLIAQPGTTDRDWKKMFNTVAENLARP